MIHTQGNSVPDYKNLSSDESLRICRTLLSKTDATLLLLDWDSRVPRLQGYRVRHLTDHWRRIDLVTFWELLQSAQLLIGVDSGPLHFSRMTSCPAIGIWTKHHPADYAVPRRNAIHVVPKGFREKNQYTRHEWQIVESPDSGRQTDGEFIGNLAAWTLGSEPRWLSKNWSRDYQLQQWLEWTESRGGPLSDYIDRHRSFGLALDTMTQLEHPPVVVETGCVRAAEDWGGAGFSTLLLGTAVDALGGEYHSIDLSVPHVEFARQWTKHLNAVSIHHAHSHEWLSSKCPKSVDIFFSDSADLGTPGFEESCLKECQLVAERVRSLIMIDDTVWNGRWTGKGALAVPWLLETGWRIAYSGYQTCLFPPL